MEMSNKRKINKKELLEQAYQLGFKYEKANRGCGQSCLAAVQKVLGMEDNMVFKAATGFAGGVGLVGISACGALLGGTMALGQKFGRELSNFADPEGMRFKGYALTKKLHERFISEYGGSACSDIQKKLFGRTYDLWDEGDYQRFDDDGGHTVKCPEVVGKAVQWTVELILEEDDKRKKPE